MIAAMGVIVLLALLLVVQGVLHARERLRWAHMVVARHAPDLIALDRKPRKPPKPRQEPARQLVPTRPWEGAD